MLLSIAATCLLTGALHEDGLADTCDGLGAADRDRALAIMRDSRIGTYGALGLGLVLALKASALAAMRRGTAAAALVAGHAASRAVGRRSSIATSRYARAAGTGASPPRASWPRARARGRHRRRAAPRAPARRRRRRGADAAPSASPPATLLARALFERRLGGYTGDCLGATQQLSEAGFYLGMLAWL